MTIERKLLGTTPVSGEVLPEAVSFDGSSDYLLRTSDLTNNTDGKTFTFSCWVYGASGGTIYHSGGASFTDGVSIHFEQSGELNIKMDNPSGSTVFSVEHGGAIALNTWNHLLISCDMSSTSNRHIYVNDVALGNSYLTYTDSDIDFTSSTHSIVQLNKLKGRLSNLFLDYTYRDLSVEANRRLFIDAEGKPASSQDSVDKYLDSKFSAYPTSFGSSGAAMNTLLFNGDGTKVYYGSSDYNTLYQYSLSTAYDITTSSYDSVSKSFQQTNSNDNPVGMAFNANGSKIFVNYVGLQKISEYALSTNYNISTASLTSSFSVSSQVSSPRALDFSSDGTKMFVGNSSSGSIYTYTLSTGYLLSTASYTSATALPSITQLYSINFSNSGLSLSLNGGPLGFKQYTLTTAYDLSTASLTGSKFILTVYGQVAVSSGKIAYGSDAIAYQANLTTPYDVSTAVYGKAAGTPAAPILYLPMTDAATAGSNSGTGGDFTVNGVLATAERGPNQDNCSASTFDGSNDYLNKTGMSAGVGKKQLTISLIRSNNISAANILAFGDSGANRSQIRFTQYISAEVKNPSNTPILAFEPDMGYKIGANAHVTISFDLTDTSKRHVYVNGLPISVTWNTYTNDSFDVYGCDVGRIAGDRYNGTLGEFFIDTVYYDLATENPFWDSDLGKPNSVRKVIEDTGVTPLIALPLIGSDAGNNLGSGGDFTVNSGPFVGARGGSEFWARSVTCYDNQLLKGGPTPSNTHKITLALCYYHINGTTSGGDMLFSKVNLSDTGDYIKFKVSDNHQQELEIRASSTNLLTVTGGSSSNTATGWVTILISIDNASTSTRHYYVDGSNSDTSFVTYSNSSYSIDDGNLVVGGLQTGTDDFGSFLYSDIAFVYFNESYIDFSQESNRNKFIDQLGYPRDLTKQISDGDIANPLVYLKMEDTSALGTNSGTGNNFAYKGTPVAGKDFTK